MSIKADNANKRTHRRYTKKLLQMSGGANVYTTNDIPEYAETGVKSFLEKFGSAVDLKYKYTIENLSGDKKVELETFCNDDKNLQCTCTSSRTMMMMTKWNCSIKSGSKFSNTILLGLKTKFAAGDTLPVYEITIQGQDTRTGDAAMLYYAKKIGFTVKNAAGKSIPSMTDEDFKQFEKTNAKNVEGVKKLYIVPVILSDTLNRLTPLVQTADSSARIIGEPIGNDDTSGRQTANPPSTAKVITTDAGLKALINFANDTNEFTVKDSKDVVLFAPSSGRYAKDVQKKLSIDDIVNKGLTNTTPNFDYDDSEFNKLYKDLVEDNPGMKLEIAGRMYGTNKVPMLIKPTELVKKQQVYTILKTIRNSVVDPSDPGNKELANVALTIRRNMTASFFLTLKQYSEAPASISDVVKESGKDPGKTPLTKFIAKLYDSIPSPDDAFTASGRLIPIISTLRDLSIGKYTVNFDSKVAGEAALKKQIQDVEKGIENEFAIMSAFVGTKSQKVATKTALLAGMATGIWSLVSTLEKNPNTSAMLAAGIASAGPQAIIVGAVLAAVAISYFVYLKLQDKYAKYFNVIRTLNEFMIVLNKIDRLVRLSVRISERYQFDVNLKEIEAQLKILFKRFDKMLSEDDVGKIEQDISKMSKVPDFGAVAAEAEAKAEENANKALTSDETKADGKDGKDGKDDNEVVTGTGQTGQGGGGFGDFIFKVTFDVEMWNQKLNDDVVKLNIYFTTAMTEFSMVLNVIQMGFLTSESTGDKTILKANNDSIKQSTEYRKMVIGILLNDILKLKVDYSYCNRGNSITNTKEESICSDLENIGVDAVGNRRSKFKEKLHGLIEHLVKVLNNKNSPYPPEIKIRIVKAVIEPYIAMIKKATPEFGLRNKFFLTETAKMEPADIDQAKLDTLKNVQSGGEGWRDSLSRLTNKLGDKVVGNTPPSKERDADILKELKTRAYEFVSHDDLTKFLIAVDKFVKAENEPSLKERAEAKEVATVISEAISTPVELTQGNVRGVTVKDLTLQSGINAAELVAINSAKDEFVNATAKYDNDKSETIKKALYDAYTTVVTAYKNADQEVPGSITKPDGYDDYKSQPILAVSRDNQQAPTQIQDAAQRPAAEETPTTKTLAPEQPRETYDEKQIKRHENTLADIRAKDDAKRAEQEAAQQAKLARAEAAKPILTFTDETTHTSITIQRRIKGNPDPEVITLSLGDCFEFEKNNFNLGTSNAITQDIIAGKIIGFTRSGERVTGMLYDTNIKQNQQVAADELLPWNSIKKVNCPGQTGGRRLTRKKRRANKKKVRQTKAVKKYNKVAMKGKFLTK
jgi:hypothetical protein